MGQRNQGNKCQIFHWGCPSHAPECTLHPARGHSYIPSPPSKEAFAPLPRSKPSLPHCGSTQTCASNFADTSPSVHRKAAEDWEGGRDSVSAPFPALIYSFPQSPFHSSPSSSCYGHLCLSPALTYWRQETLAVQLH